MVARSLDVEVGGMLATMLSPDRHMLPGDKDSVGAVLIHRSRELFGQIHCHFHNNPPLILGGLKNLSLRVLDALSKECNFYQTASLNIRVSSD